MTLRLAALLAAGLATALPCAAQQLPQSTPDWDWYFSAGAGLVGREIATWKPVHEALNPAGWDSHFQAGCVGLCQNASDPVEGRPAAPSAAVRRRLDGPWQVRLMGAMASPGYYPGGYQGIPLTVEPKTTTVGVQLVAMWKGFWVGAGPSWYDGAVTTTAGSNATRTRQSGAGLVLTGAATFPRVTSWFIEATIERRFAGTVTSPLMTVPGAPDVPAFDVPLSATVLSVGVGWRL